MNSFFLHDIKHISASTPASLGAPMLLHMETLHDIVEITLFLEDQNLVDRLVEVINEAVERSLYHEP
jgi:hypothetical protein